MFMAEPSTTLFTHAECGYLQIATETGLVGLALLISAIALMAAWCCRGVLFSRAPEEQALWAVLTAALVVSLVHSTVDFVWYIPSCLAPVVMLAGCASRLRRPDLALASNEPTKRPVGYLHVQEAACVFATTAAVLLAIGPARSSLDRDAYTASAAALKTYNASRFTSHSMADQPDAAAGLLASRVYHTDQMVDRLRAAERADPLDPLTQMRLARLCLYRFELLQSAGENVYGIDAIRDAALTAEFGSREATEQWLGRALGESSGLLIEAHRHAATAVRLCPLLAEAYFYLADLRFLSPPADRTPEQLVAQALSVKPYRGSVLYEAGKQQFLAGRQDDAMKLWKDAAARPGPHRLKLAASVSGVVPAELFINEFQPDWELTQACFELYRERGTEDDLRALARHAMVAARSSAQKDSPRIAAYHWMQASVIQASIGNRDAAVACAEESYRLDPVQFHIRMALADALFQAGRYAEADSHLRWCVARRPDNGFLRTRLEQVARQRTGVSRTAATPNKSAGESQPVEPAEEVARRQSKVEEIK
jgi:tetratricopeptide (TPR) repeat protein